jgi:RsiW-degrading membrane proteinase PrsW (M82 family)
MLLLALAIAPGLAISIYIFLKDQYNREPRKHLLISFLLGFLSAAISVVLELGLTTSTDRYTQGSVWGTAFLAYCIVAFVEEWCKYVMVRLYAFPKPEFDEPFDGIVYCVMVSMGFATAENIAYVYQYGFTVAVVRMFLSVPAHATFAVIMGYYMGKGWTVTGWKRSRLLMTGLFVAVFWHGTFDFFLFLEESKLVEKYVAEGLLFIGAIISFIFAINLARNAIKEHVGHSERASRSRITNTLP